MVIDCQEITMRIIITLALNNRWCLHQLDINNVFYNGSLIEEVFMSQPAGFKDTNYPHYVYKIFLNLLFWKCSLVNQIS